MVVRGGSALIEIAEREKIYAEPKFVQGEELLWERKDGSDKINARVLRLNGEALSLRVTSRHKYSFALLYKGNITIRRWDTARHRDPDGVLFIGPHKQPRADKDSCDWPYYVYDIPTDNVAKALQAFLKECNITIEGQHQGVLY